MSTESQMAANRENSQRSTGPTTPEGKRKSAMNSLKHSFAGQTVIIPAHEADAYAKHFQSFRDEYSPKGPTEEFLVQSLSELTWSTQQLRALISNSIAMAGCRPSERPDRLENATPEIDTAIAQARNFDGLAHRLHLFSVYEQRKMRLFNTTLKQLTELQQTRKAAEKASLEEAARLRQSDKATRQPHESEWRPEENGFVCSIQEIDQYILRQNRLARLTNHQKCAA